MLRVANRVKESTLTSGSGTIALAGASNGYQSFFSVLSNGDTSYYTIVNGDSWEVGIGTYSSSTLSRDVVLSSSNSNNKLDLNGQSYVFIAYPSEKSVYKDQNDQVVVGSSGVIIESGIPSNTSNVLYNTSGILYFNGLPVNNDPVDTGEAYSLVTTVFNRSSSPVPKFSVVYISGGQGDLPTIGLAIANGESISSKTFGITQESISAMSSGHVVSYGNITQLDTDYYNPNAPHGDINGRVLYLSPTISGGLTLDKPYAPNHLVALGTVIRTHQNEGVFNVRIQNGFELEELHNVATTGAVSGQFLKYNGGLWRNTGILSSDISDFSSAVSGLVPSISGSGYARVLLSNNIYTVSVTGLQPSGNYSTSGHQHTSSDITNFNLSVSGLLNPYALLNSGNFTTLLVTNVPVSLSGHLHTSSQITDFNSAVSGLLPFTGILGSGYVTLNSFNRILTIGVTGLQPSGNYSISGHTHTTSNITDFNSATSGLLIPYALLNSGNFTNLFVAGTPVSLSGHTHTSSNITNFNSSVSGLLPSVSGSGYARVLLSNNVYTVSVTGLQPSGNYSISGHQHASSDITNFNSSVSGLLAPYALLNSGNFTTLFVTGTPVSLSGHTHSLSGISSGLIYEDNGNIFIGTDTQTVNLDIKGALTVRDLSVFFYDILANKIAASELLVGGTPVSLSGHVHTSNEIIDFNSAVSGLLPVRDIVAGTGIAISNIGGVFTINSSGSTGGGGSSNVVISDSGVGRLLASDGTSSGIIGQSNLTFIDNNLTANGVIINNGNNLYMWSNFR